MCDKSVKKHQRGKPLTRVEKQVILNVFSKLMDYNPEVAVYDIVKLTAEFTGVSHSSVMNIRKEHRETGVISTPKLKRKRPKTVLGKVDELVKSAIRSKVQELVLKSESLTVVKILEAVNSDPDLPNFKRSTFYTLLLEIAPLKKKKRGKPVLGKIDDSMKSAIRCKIREIACKDESPTITKLLEAVNSDPDLPNFKRSSFYRLLVEIAQITSLKMQNSLQIKETRLETHNETRQYLQDLKNFLSSESEGSHQLTEALQKALEAQSTLEVHEQEVRTKLKHQEQEMLQQNNTIADLKHSLQLSEENVRKLEEQLKQLDMKIILASEGKDGKPDKLPYKDQATQIGYETVSDVVSSSSQENVQIIQLEA
ncbi:hypothetical protein C0J52_09177 [Blattella germanica]|nr:hypothetical protein C0J52_09177 [Blattella germanica]